MIKIGVDRMVFGVLILLVGIWNYNIDVHIDCHKYSSGPMDEKACNDFQNNYYYIIKSIPIGFGLVSICFSFINPRDLSSRPYFENVKTQVCSNCKEELNGRAWCGNKSCIEIWRERFGGDLFHDKQKVGSVE